MDTLLAVIARWLHIGAAVFLIGAAMFGRWMVTPAAAGLDGEARRRLADGLAKAFRPAAALAIATLAASGFYNVLGKTNAPVIYWPLFGLKLLLALHIIAVSMLLGKAGVDEAKRARWMTGVAISGLAVMVISAYLGTLSV